MNNLKTKLIIITGVLATLYSGQVAADFEINTNINVCKRNGSVSFCIGANTSNPQPRYYQPQPQPIYIVPQPQTYVIVQPGTYYQPARVLQYVPNVGWVDSNAFKY